MSHNANKIPLQSIATDALKTIGYPSEFTYITSVASTTALLMASTKDFRNGENASTTEVTLVYANP
ncbi:hypothetical protein GCM10027020_04810 [Nocardioides salsibiostraticola]